MSSPRFLLLNPWIHDFAAFDLWSRPLGFLSLYSYLRNRGFSVDYMDALHLAPEVAEEWDLEYPDRRANGTGSYYCERIPKPEPYRDVPRYYRRFGIPPRVLKHQLREITAPDAVFFTSGMTYWYTGLIETVELVNDVYPDAESYLGGTYATLCPEHARENVPVDRVLPGPWETAMLPFLESEYGVSGESGPPDFNEQPFPAMDLYPDSEVAATRLTQGCPYGCDYCASDRLSGDFEGRSPERFADEIEWNVRGGRTEIALYDDALLVQAEQFLVPALQCVAARGLNCRFHTPNGLHAKFMTPEIARLFRRNNFATVRLSFEAVTGRAREASDGKATPEDFVEAMNALREAGYEPGEVEAYMLIGLPGQKDGSIRETAEFIHRQGAITRTAQFSPVPGTKLGEAHANLPDGVRREPLLHNSTIAPGWDFDVERYNRLKNVTRNLNQCLRQGQ